MFTSADGSFIRRAIFLHNTKCATSGKVQQLEREKKQNCKYQQGTVISVNEVWHHILNYSEVIAHMSFFIIQTNLLETRTGKSLRNPENPTNNHFTQYDANVNNNYEKWLKSRMN